MPKHTGGGFAAQLDRIGERDAQRQLHRDKLAKRQAARERHENPPDWQFRTVSGNRRNRNGWEG